MSKKKENLLVVRLSDEERASLEALSDSIHVPKSSIVRRALDEFTTKIEEQGADYMYRKPDGKKVTIKED